MRIQAVRGPTRYWAPEFNSFVPLERAVRILALGTSNGGHLATGSHGFEDTFRVGASQAWSRGSAEGVMRDSFRVAKAPPPPTAIQRLTGVDRRVGHEGARLSQVADSY